LEDGIKLECMSMEKADRCRQREPTWGQPLALAVQGATIEQPGSVYDTRARPGHSHLLLK